MTTDVYRDGLRDVALRLPAIAPGLPWSERLALTTWRARLRFATLAKRAVDLFGAGTAVLLLSPVFVLTWLAVRLEDGGPAFFSQQRIGQHGRPFRMLKFRSMTVNAEALKAQLLASNESAGGVLFKMRRDPRVTRVGRIIRRLSIDELPQLLQVLRGEMSLVGPRPALPEEVRRYRVTDRDRLSAKPGLTGLWQVSGRSRIGFEGQMHLDLLYVRRWSVLRDLQILVRTVRAVAVADGAC